MKNKLICFDLDETVLRTDKSIHEENRDALQEAITMGHSVSIVTGRSIRGSLSIAKDLGLLQKNCYLICFQGNLIFDLSSQSIILSYRMDTSLALKILSFISDHGFYAQTFDSNGILTIAESEELKTYCGITHEIHRLIDSWDAIGDDGVFKAMAINYSDPKRLDQLYDDYRKESFSTELDCFFSGPYYLEFCQKGYNKGFGVKKLAEYLNFDQQDVIAIGDERNDISMIKWAGLGVAMKNAHPLLRECADVITSADNDHGGVAEMIRKYALS